MESVFVKNSPTLGELSVIISPDDYLPTFEKELKKIASKAHIRGFRPGKTPVSVVRNMYGKAIFIEELMKLLNSTLDTYLKENDIDYLGELLPLHSEEEIDFNFNERKNYHFKFQVATPSPFELDALNTLSVKQYKPFLNEEEIDKAIQTDTERFSKEHKVEQIEDVYCFITGQASWQIDKETAKDEDTFEISTCYLPLKFLKAEKQEAIIGKKVGEKFSIVPSQDLDLGEDNKKMGYIFGIFDEEEALELKDKDVEILIEVIHQRKPRELDREFFEEMFPNKNIETLEQFRQEFAIAENQTLESNFSYFNDELIKDAVLEAIQFDLPDEFLKNWLQRKNPKLSHEDIEKEYLRASKSIRWSVIQRKIISKEKINVSNEEINNYANTLIMKQLQQYGLLNNSQLMKSMPNLVKNYLSENDGENFIQIYENILDIKCLESIKSKIQIEYIEIHWKELDNMVTEYFKKNASIADTAEASTTEL